VVLVGEKCIGKTLFLSRLRKSANKKSVTMNCHFAASVLIREELAIYLGVEKSASDERLAAALGRYELVCFDNAHCLFQPTIGGLTDLRWIFSLLNEPPCRGTTALFAFNAESWRYVSRAVEGESLFDDVITLPKFTEEQVKSVLDHFLKQMKTVVSLDLLVPTGSSVESKATLRRRAIRNFARVLWDYTDGNPGLVKYWLRRSLYEDKETHTLFLELFTPPSSRQVTAMESNLRFTLSTALKTGVAEAQTVSMCVGLNREQAIRVLERLRVAHLLEKTVAGYQVTAHWYIATLVALKQRELETSP
jgi:hypothetical protein